MFSYYHHHNNSTMLLRYYVVILYYCYIYYLRCAEMRASALRASARARARAFAYCPSCQVRVKITTNHTMLTDLPFRWPSFFLLSSISLRFVYGLWFNISISETLSVLMCMFVSFFSSRKMLKSYYYKSIYKVLYSKSIEIWSEFIVMNVSFFSVFCAILSSFI